MLLLKEVLGGGRIIIEFNYFDSKSQGEWSPCANQEYCIYEKIKILNDPNYCRKSPGNIDYPCTQMAASERKGFIIGKTSDPLDELTYEIVFENSTSTKAGRPITISIQRQQFYKPRSNENSQEIIPSSKLYIFITDGIKSEKVELLPLLLVEQ